MFAIRPQAITFAEIRSTQFDITGRFEVPRSPQGHPVLLQAGDSDDGREFGAAKADAIFTGTAPSRQGQTFYTDVKGRLAKYGTRRTTTSRFSPPRHSYSETSPRTRRKGAAHPAAAGRSADRHRVPRTDLGQGPLVQYDPDGPLPEVDPTDDVTITRGRGASRQGSARGRASSGGPRPRPRT